jgi:hypothetical protein
LQGLHLLLPLFLCGLLLHQLLLNFFVGFWLLQRDGFRAVGGGERSLVRV